jgi:hypothetical protein
MTVGDGLVRRSRMGRREIERDRTKREPVAGISKNQALKWWIESIIIPEVVQEGEKNPVIRSIPLERAERGSTKPCGAASKH